MVRACFVIWLVALSVPVKAAEKVALIIGNAAYESFAELDNPVNDATKMSEALREQGFEVHVHVELGKSEMERALLNFGAKADKADIALVFFAGHGIEVNGTNYLIPVDAQLSDEQDVPLETVSLDIVLGQISRARNLKMVILDACRNNPFAARMIRSNRGRSVRSRGLGPIKSETPSTLIAYAAAPGEVTSDGLSGGNSPFTEAFLAALKEPPKDVRLLLGSVRDRMKRIDPDAEPYVTSSLGGNEIIINPSEAVSGNHTGTSSSNRCDSIDRDFELTRQIGTKGAWMEFLACYREHNDEFYLRLAKRELSDLQAAESDNQVAVIEDPTSPEEPKPSPGRAEDRSRETGQNDLIWKEQGVWFDPSGTLASAEECFDAFGLSAGQPFTFDGKYLFPTSITLIRRCGADRVRLLVSVRTCKQDATQQVGSYVEPGRYTFTNPKRTYYSFGGNPGDEPLKRDETFGLSVVTVKQVRPGDSLVAAYRLDRLDTPRPTTARGYPIDPPCP